MGIAALSASGWEKCIGSNPTPKHLHPFRELRGDKHVAPATPGDILIHIRGRQEDVCFELGRLLLQKMGDAVTVVDQVHGFKYFDERDLLGFVDGTENPEEQDAVDAVLIDDDPNERFNGGSYVIVQKYVHDMTSWGQTAVEEQERIIGRTKMDDVELDEDDQPANSHVAVNQVTDDEGNELEILRENMAFGDLAAGTFGTYFIGYSKDPGVTEQMLFQMFIGEPRGNTDRILEFSTALTGGLFFVPSVELLDDLDSLTTEPVENEAAQPSTTDSPTTNAPDESLGIGSLR